MIIYLFLDEIKDAINKFFPNANIDYRIIRTTHLYVRITINEDTFIDIYFNTETGRKDFSLIYKNERIYGFDNLGGWHYHPYETPTQHISCPEPKIEDVFKEMKSIIHSSNIP